MLTNNQHRDDKLCLRENVFVINKPIYFAFAHKYGLLYSQKTKGGAHHLLFYLLRLAQLNKNVKSLELLGKLFINNRIL